MPVIFLLKQPNSKFPITWIFDLVNISTIIFSGVIIGVENLPGINFLFMALAFLSL